MARSSTENKDSLNNASTLKADFINVLGLQGRLAGRIKNLDEAEAKKSIEMHAQGQVLDHIKKQTEIVGKMPKNNASKIPKQEEIDFLKKYEATISNDLAVELTKAAKEIQNKSGFDETKLAASINTKLQDKYKTYPEFAGQESNLKNFLVSACKNSSTLINASPTKKYQDKYLSKPLEIKQLPVDPTGTSAEDEQKKAENKDHRDSPIGKFEAKMDKREEKLLKAIGSLSTDAKNTASSLQTYYTDLRAKLTSELKQPEKREGETYVYAEHSRERANTIIKLLSKTALEKEFDTLIFQEKARVKAKGTAGDSKIDEEPASIKELIALKNQILAEAEADELSNDLLAALQRQQRIDDDKLSSALARKAAGVGQFDPAGTPKGKVHLGEDNSPDHLDGNQEYQGTEGTFNGIKMNLLDNGGLTYQPSLLSLAGSKSVQMDEARSGIGMYFQHRANASKTTLYINHLPSASFIDSFLTTMEKHFAPPECKSPKKIEFSEKVMSLMNSVFTDNTAEVNAIKNRINTHNGKVDSYLADENKEYGIEGERKSPKQG